MVLLLTLTGSSLFCLGVGLWLGYMQSYRACIRGQRAWLKLHCPGLENIEP
jgi:hypothetical protein